VYDRLPHSDQGILTRTRIKLVNGARLAELARFLGLERFVVRSAQLEQSTGGVASDATLEDALEAFCAAVYLDQRALAARRIGELSAVPRPSKRSRHGLASESLLRLTTPDGVAFAQTSRFVVGLYERFVDFATMLATDTNYKDILTKHFQRHYKAPPRFVLVREEGPTNRRVFTFAVEHVNGDRLGEGRGSSKRAAQQAAARAALDRLCIPAQYVS